MSEQAAISLPELNLNLSWQIIVHFSHIEFFFTVMFKNMDTHESKKKKKSVKNI